MDDYFGIAVVLVVMHYLKDSQAYSALERVGNRYLIGHFF